VSTNDPRDGRRGEEPADWRSSPVRPPQPSDDDEATQAVPPTPRSIHEENTLDAAQFVRPQQSPTAPPSQPWASSPAAGQKPAALPGGQPASPPPPGWGGPPPGAGSYPPHQPAPAWSAPPSGPGYPTHKPPQRGGGPRRWWLIGGAVAAVVVVIVALVVATSSDDSASTDATATSPAQVPAGPTTTPRGATTAAPAPPPTAAPPPPPVVDAAALPELLLPADQINQRMNTTGMTAIPVESALLYGSVTPPHCTGAWGPVYDVTYNGSGYIALAVQGVFRDQTHRLVQAVVAFPDAGAAKAFYDRQVVDWNACKSTHIRFEQNGVTEADVGVPSVTGDLLSVMLVPTTSQVAGQQCERDMTVRGNVVVDVRACSPTVGSAGSSIAREIADKVGRTP
jgi:hypothetical protein